MSNNKYNNLDSLFKSAADDYELPFNEKAWASMQLKLDKEFGSDTSRKNGIKLYGIAALILLLGGLAMYYFQKPANSVITEKGLVQKENAATGSIPKVIDNKGEVHAEKINENTNINGNASAANNNESIDNKVENSSIVSIKNEDGKNAIEKSASHKNEINKISVNTNKNTLVKNTKTADATDITIPVNKNNSAKKEIEKNSASPAGNNAVVKNNIAVKESKKTDKVIVKRNSETKNAYNKVDNDVIISAPNNASNTITKKAITASNTSADAGKFISNINAGGAKTYTAVIASNLLHKKYIPNYKAAEEEATKPKAADKMFSANGVRLLKVYPEPTLPNRWYFALTGGSNTSFTSNPKLNEIRYAANFFIGYNLSNHVSFQTGLAYRTGTYAAAYNQFKYTGTDISLTKYITGAQVDMAAIEIPVEIKYQFSDIPNKGLFLTAGFRKLLYRKDNNMLNLDYGNGNYKKEGWNLGNSATKFELFQFSVGYQYRLNDMFILTAQQDIQLPLNHIGGAGTQMISTGLQLGIRYNFGFINHSGK